MKLVTGLIRLFLILIDAILFFLFLLFFFWFFAKIKIPNQKKIYQIKINTWILRSKLNSLCANKKPNIEYRKPNSEFRIPNTVTAHTTTKYYNDNTATRHTPTPPTPHSCFVYQQTINNKQKHCIIYRNTRKKKKTTHNYNDKDDVPGKVDEKATQLHAIASLKVLLDATKPQRGGATTSAANHVKINLKETTLADRPNGNIDTTLDSVSAPHDHFRFGPIVIRTIVLMIWCSWFSLGMSFRFE